MLKSGKRDFQRGIEKHLNSIGKSLNDIVQRVESNEKNKKETNEYFLLKHKEKK